MAKYGARNGGLVEDFAGNRLTAENRRCAILKMGGMTNEAIARFVDATPEAVGYIVNQPAVQRYMMQMEATFVDDLRPIAHRVNKSIEDHSERAAQIVFEIMEEMHKREEIRAQQLSLTSAQDILDRAGHKPTTKVESTNIHAHAVSDHVLDRMMEVLSETKQPKAIDITEESDKPS
jgi:hypothetical protein